MGALRIFKREIFYVKVIERECKLSFNGFIFERFFLFVYVLIFYFKSCFSVS